MGKGQRKDNVPKTCVLKVVMHCQCSGCIKKIADGVRKIALSEGVERADLVVEKAEVIVVGTMDPEEICCLFHELTQKHVKIEIQTAMSEGGTAESQQNKNPVWQALDSPGRPRNGRGDAFPVTPPSAPPLRSLAAPSPGVWAASDVAGTLAAYVMSSQC